MDTFEIAMKPLVFCVFGPMECVQGWPWGDFGAHRVPPGRPERKNRDPNCPATRKQAAAAATAAASRAWFSEASLLLSFRVFPGPRFRR